MRTTYALFKGPGRRPQNEDKVDYKSARPLKLKDYITGQGSKSNQVACLQEMAILLACFKANEFDQAVCAKEISSFQKCFSDHRKSLAERKELEAKGLLVPGSRQLTDKQVSRFLKKFPTQ